MAKTAANAPVTVVPGGDSYLNDARTKALCAQALKARPDADLIELDATSADQYAFDEAVSPSLLSDVAVVKLVNLQNADDKLAEALVAYTKQAAKDPNAAGRPGGVARTGASGSALIMLAAFGVAGAAGLAASRRRH